MRKKRLAGGARLAFMVRQRVVVGLADDLQIVVRPVGAHLLQQVTELGDGEDVGRDLVAKRRHSAIIRPIAEASDLRFGQGLLKSGACKDLSCRWQAS